MKRILTVLCIVSCLLLSACNQAEGPDATDDTSVEREQGEEIVLIEPVGIESVVIVKPNMGGPYVDPQYIIEYYAPNDVAYIDGVLQYFNESPLVSALDPGTFLQSTAVRITVTYNNGDQILLRGINDLIGVTKNDEQTRWYALAGDNPITPEEFQKLLKDPCGIKIRRMTRIARAPIYLPLS